MNKLVVILIIHTKEFANNSFNDYKYHLSFTPYAPFSSFPHLTFRLSKGCWLYSLIQYFYKALKEIIVANNLAP